MDTRIIRTLAVGAGAGALVLGMAAPALADDPINPYKFTVAVNEVKTLSAKFDPVGSTPCPANTTWTARTAGKQNAITVTPAASCDPATGMLSVQVAENPNSKKKNAVVKITGVNSDSTIAPIVKTFVVKVTGQAKPGKGPKG